MDKNESPISKIQVARARSSQLEMSGADFKAQCESALKLLVPFVDAVRDAPGYPSLANAPVSDLLKCHFSGEASPIEQLILTQLDDGIETASGNFMGYIPGGGLLTGALADLVTAVTNRYSGFNFTAPGAAKTENQIIRWLCELFNLGPEAWGSLTSGATMATLNCLLAARESVNELPTEKLVIYLTDQAHHSAMRTLKTLGLNKATIHLIETDEKSRMRADKLSSSIQFHFQEGLTPFLIIASAGTTNTGAVDPLDKIAKLAQKHGLWLHIDAAYGGFFILCKETAHLFRGIENADSIAVDPHKGMFLPYGVGAGLVRNHRLLKSALHEDAPYLAHVETGMERSPADYSFELTRHNRAPRVQLSIDLFGLATFTEALREKILLARFLGSQLASMPGIIVFSEPDLSIVAFRANTDVETQELLDFIISDGITHLSSTQFGGYLWIRACIMSFRTHLEHVQLIIDKAQMFQIRNEGKTR